MSRPLAVAYLLWAFSLVLDGYTLGGASAVANGPQPITECHIDDVKACRCHTYRPTERLWGGSEVWR